MRRLVPVNSEYLGSIRELLSASIAQQLTDMALGSFVLSATAFALYYLFFAGPMISRAQLLDDILEMALVEKRVIAPETSRTEKQ